MKIELNNITIRDISRKFIDSQEDGVIGYDSKLNIRPAYQREFIHKFAQRLAVIETVLKWVSNDHISDYMATHQHDKNASELWAYFQRVIGWTKSMFPVYRREMKGIDWGLLYNKFRNTSYNPTDNEERIKVLMMDDDVTNKKGIYKYILDGQEKHLNIRQFSNKMKREVYERQAGICVSCQNKFEFGEMEGDHITPWHDGGTTSTDNLQMLCKACNRVKGGK